MSGKKLRGGFLVHINGNIYMHIEKRKRQGYKEIYSKRKEKLGRGIELDI